MDQAHANIMLNAQQDKIRDDIRFAALAAADHGFRLSLGGTRALETAAANTVLMDCIRQFTEEELARLGDGHYTGPSESSLQALLVIIMACGVHVRELMAEAITLKDQS